MADQELAIATTNLSIEHVKHMPDQVFAALKDLMTKPGGPLSTGVQEGGAAQHIFDRLEREGVCKVFRGHGKPGQNSTPILYRRDLDVHPEHFVALPLSSRVYVGLAGAGASKFLKPKWYMAINYTFNGRTITHANCHGVASASLPHRRPTRNRFFKKCGEYSNRIQGLLFYSGDLNQEPNSGTLALLRHHAHLVSLQQWKKVLVTLKKSMSPDDIMWRFAPGRVQPVDLEAIQGPSDHKWLIGRFNIASRP